MLEGVLGCVWRLTVTLQGVASGPGRAALRMSWILGADRGLRTPWGAGDTEAKEAPTVAPLGLTLSFYMEASQGWPSPKAGISCFVYVGGEAAVC